MIPLRQRAFITHDSFHHALETSESVIIFALSMSVSFVAKIDQKRWQRSIQFLRIVLKYCNGNLSYENDFLLTLGCFLWMMWVCVYIYIHNFLNTG